MRQQKVSEPSSPPADRSKHSTSHLKHHNHLKAGKFVTDDLLQAQLLQRDLKCATANEDSVEAGSLFKEVHSATGGSLGLASATEED